MRLGAGLVWAPPGRLVLGWQLNAEWDYDPELVTEVEVRFVDVGDGMTRVELEHRGLEAYGEARDGVRSALDSPGGWSGLLDRFTGEAGAGG